MVYQIDPYLCQACGNCQEVCMQNALFSYEGQYFLIDEDNCLDCGSCVEFCQEKAILLKGVGQPVLDAEIDAIKELVYQELVRA